MAEVLKHGNTYRSYKCSRCGCLFKVSEKDEYTDPPSRLYIQSIVRPDYPTCFYVKCPECHHELCVRKEERNK